MTERPARSLPPAYFEVKYEAEPDPWGFASSPYERAKYRATLDALPRARYRRGFEVGCSIGVLSRLLAARCEALLSADVAEAALARARERCRDLRHVRFARMRLPAERPDGAFDLVVVSEVAYYWSRDDLAGFARFVRDALEPGGEVVLVHWTPVETDYPLTGDEAQDGLLAALAGFCRPVLSRREATYRLDVVRRPPAPADDAP